MPKLRRATPQDRDAIVTLHRALYQKHRDTLMSEATKRLYAYQDFAQVLADDVDAMLRNPATAMLVAEYEGDSEPPATGANALTGYITGYVELDPRRVLGRKGVVGDWYVEQRSRGKGVGRDLLNALLDVFKEAGCNIAEIATWPANHATRRFIERAGFEEIQVVHRRPL